MAKVTGPLMSMDASGGFGGALVFGRWKGRNTVHQLVIPANPNTADQETSRNRMRIAAAVQRHVNLDATVKAGQTATDKARLSAITPAGQAWNGYLIGVIVGAGAVNATAADGAWAALTAPQRTAWDNAAAALTPAYTAVNQTDPGGTTGTPATAGRAFFAHQYGLYIAGLDAAPTGTPPTYA